MKKKFLFLMAAIAASVVSSCSLEKGYDVNYINALVTVKNDDSKCMLQIDDNTRVYPANLSKDIFGGKQVRALTKIALGPDEKSLVDGQTVNVMWIDSVLTKKVITSDKTVDYGKDPVNIYNDWLTVAEDGYVTLHISSFISRAPHYVNLVSGTNIENPYELVFHHDARGDMDGMLKDAIVAFDIRDILPKTAGEVELTIRFDSFNGPKSFKLKTIVK